MAFLKKEAEGNVSTNDENCSSCVNNCHGKDCDNALETPLNVNSEVSTTSDVDNTGGVNNEAKSNSDTNHEHATNNEVASNTHSDHTYISDSRTLKQEVLQDINESVVHPAPNLISCEPLHNIVKQEMKVCPQNCNAHIKEELYDVKPLNNFFIKTETTDDNTDINIEAESVSNNCNLQYSCAQTHKCNKCNLNFINELHLKAHTVKCGFNGDSISVPFVKTVKTIPTAKVQKYNQCDHSRVTRKLIENVRKHPCLYNTNTEDYSNTQLKNVIWTNIASACNLPNGLAAKTEWKKLKSNFLDSLKRNGNHTKKQIWKYQQMDFIIPYIHNRPTKTDTRIENSNNIEELNHAAQASLIPEMNENEVDEDAEDDCPLVHSTPPTKKAKIASPHREATSLVKTPQRSREDRQESSRQSRDEIRPSTSSQPLDMFFLSMRETTKNLPPYVQLQVKKKIFQAVIEAEEIVAAMNNDQEKSNMFHASTSADDEYPNNMSPYSVHSAADESWQDE